MKLFRPLVGLLIAALAMSAAAFAQTQEVVKDQARLYTTWDANYLYVGFKVDSPDVRGSKKSPNAEVAGDDTVSVYIETDGRKSSLITPACRAMEVSVAGGSRFLAGDSAGAWVPTPVMSFKYGTAIQGTVNNNDDIDMGFTVEIALPWELLKVKTPGLGDMMGLNAIVRRAGSKPGEFVSLSPKVTTEADIVDPSKWSNIVFAPYSFGAATTSPDKVLSAKYIVRAPLINGAHGEKEWLWNTSWGMDLPMSGAYVYEARFPVHRMILAQYSYSYRAEAGGADVPAVSAPWTSCERAQWHKDALSELAESGIDVVLPLYPCDEVGRSSYGDTGVEMLIAALDELRAEGRSHPYLGVMLSGDSAATAESVYPAIKSFFSMVPGDYRALAQAAKPSAGVPGCIAAIGPGAGFEPASSFADDLRGRFLQDFGLPLVLLASDDLKPVEGLDGRIPNVYGEKLDASGRVKVAAARIAAIGAVIPKNPQWIVVEDINSIRVSEEVCAAKESSAKRNEAAKPAVERFFGGKEYEVLFSRPNVPRTIPQRQFSLAEITVKNTGSKAWELSEGYYLSYRWYRKGRYHGESKVRRPLGRSLARGESMTVPIGVATVTAQGVPVPQGDAEIRFEIVRGSDNKWLSALGAQSLIVPVTIGAAPEWDASYLICKAPAVVESGKSYSVFARIRNDGSQTWKKGVTKFGCSLLGLDQSGAERIVPTRGVAAVLLKDCKPGEVAEFSLDLNLTQPNRRPLTDSENGTRHRLSFDLYNGKEWLSAVGARPFTRPVVLVDADYGPRIVDCDLPASLSPDQTIAVKVVLRNGGVRMWDRKRTKIGYRWYKPDGSAAGIEGIAAPLSVNVASGTPLVAMGSVKAPETEGRYVLVWDVQVDGKWLSESRFSRGGDILPVCVEVRR